MRKIVPMDESHISFIALLEKECFSIPRSEGEIKSELENPLYCHLVCVEDGQTAGYIGAYLVLDEMSITDVAVLNKYRRQGIADSLLKALISEAEKRNAALINLEVRASNEAAINLYKKNGFKKIGVRRGFYSKPSEDAVLMKRDLK